MKLRLNNFPREGQHQPVTAQRVSQLERERPPLNPTLDYTIGGTTEGTVHTSVAADREYTINRGHRILNQASQNVRADQMAARDEHSAHMAQLKARAMVRLQFERAQSQTTTQSNGQDMGSIRERAESRRARQQAQFNDQSQGQGH